MVEELLGDEVLPLPLLDALQLALSQSPRHPLARRYIGFQTFGCGYHEVAEVPARDVLGWCLLGRR